MSGSTLKQEVAVGIKTGICSLLLGVGVVLVSQSWLALVGVIIGVFIGIGFTRDSWEAKLACEKLLRRMDKILATFDRVRSR